ncbi:endonuclease domain-containing protein [Microbacterium sp. 179-I 3D4 NHS]|uniref:endonuclease domain-containing protein n=1 Tax=Microbacterium sp. 179-I 3D4 NHS TaxID=3142381 RepID=UPI00399F6247
MSEKRLRATDLERPFHGTRSRIGLTHLQRLALLLDALPDHAFACGASAALLWGLPLPMHVEEDARSRPHIGVPRDATRIRRAGVSGHRLEVSDDDIVVVEGMRTLRPTRLWIDVSAVLALPSLLALTDALLSVRHPLATMDELASAQRRFAGRRGAKKRGRVHELADGRAESPRESMVRLILVEAGLPAPECNVEIWDGDRFVARVDMLYRLRRLVIEYDGDHHRDPDQWSRDQIRRAELEALGYRVTVVTRRDFDDPAALVRRIRRLLAA